jgi:adenosylmethionine-8-amino-7-oxononanoate aminotransferase
MGGVELAPPADGMRWGRRVSAAAVKRGVLLRPIGDTVIVMPPLTVTSPEIHRIVTALSESIDEVCEPGEAS